MGRELRKVPPDWRHPTDKVGEYIPLLPGSFEQEREKWDKEFSQWQNGYMKSFEDEFPYVKKDETALACLSFEEWIGPRPVREAYMPEFPEGTCTHYQMYETTTEGTPLSPIFDNVEDLARWLADSEASFFGSMTTSYEHWLDICHGGVDLPCVILPTRPGDQPVLVSNGWESDAG